MPRRVLAKDFGRFKPGQIYGEETLWARDQFTVAQLEEVDLYEKEPTIQAASRQSGFLGERVNLAWWDDLVHSSNARTIEQADELDLWFEDEAETRVEPGGVMCLVGQRLSARDLHRKRLDKMVPEPDGSSHPLYRHIVYPAHHDDLCDGEHRAWDGGYVPGSGCLTEPERLSLRDWTNVQSKANYRVVYQQEDADPADILVQSEWLEGGVDLDGFDAVGCYDAGAAVGAPSDRRRQADQLRDGGSLADALVGDRVVGLPAGLAVQLPDLGGPAQDGGRRGAGSARLEQRRPAVRRDDGDRAGRLGP